LSRTDEAWPCMSWNGKLFGHNHFATHLTNSVSDLGSVAHSTWHRWANTSHLVAGKSDQEARRFWSDQLDLAS
jgi:hypothetical protein